MINWIKNKFQDSPDCKMLFGEAIKCYSIEAYRASLLLSYLGFLTYIKEMIMNSQKPNNIKNSRWDNITKELTNENKWEERILTELNNSKSPIFKINDSIRREILCWKDRRNDCAHYKEYEITHQHVEMFWLFLKSNLSKISIEGSMQSLLSKFIVFFDRTKTPASKEPDELIREIEYAVEINDLNIFFEKLCRLPLFGNDTTIHNIYYKIFQIFQENNRITNELIRFIKEKGGNYDLKFILNYPQVINYIQYTPEEIREIWNSRIWILSHYEYKIIVILLQNGKVPFNEQEELFKHIFNKFDQNRFHFLNLKENEIEFLLQGGSFLDVIYNNFFKEGKIFNTYSNFKHINAKAELITLLFSKREIDKYMMEGLKKMRENNISPDWLRDSLTRLLNDNENIRNKFIEIGNEVGCDVSFYTYFNIDASKFM